MIAAMILPAVLLSACTAAPQFEAELIFPLHGQHNHAPGIAELPGGDLIASWYRGSGERQADNVAVYGSRRRAGEDHWSAPTVLVDTPGFPDCNTCLMVDARGRLWLFWPVILANSWESSLTRYQVAEKPQESGPLHWSRSGTIFLKPDDFSAQANVVLDDMLRQLPGPLPEDARRSIEEAAHPIK